MTGDNAGGDKNGDSRLLETQDVLGSISLSDRMRQSNYDRLHTGYYFNTFHQKYDLLDVWHFIPGADMKAFVTQDISVEQFANEAGIDRYAYISKNFDTGQTSTWYNQTTTEKLVRSELIETWGRMTYETNKSYYYTGIDGRLYRSIIKSYTTHIEPNPVDLTGSISPYTTTELGREVYRIETQGTESVINIPTTTNTRLLYNVVLTEPGEFKVHYDFNMTGLWVTGSTGDDSLYGYYAFPLTDHDTPKTLPGYDKGVVLDGAAGNDLIVGSWFNDELTGGTGDDRLFGQGGGGRYWFDCTIASGHDTLPTADTKHQSFAKYRTLMILFTTILLCSLAASRSAICRLR